MNDLEPRPTTALTFQHVRVPAMRASFLGVAALGVLFGGSNLIGLLAAGSWAIRPWMTVVAAAVLVVGSLAAACNRTWGLLTLLVSATAFGGVWVAGIAPAAYLAIPALATLGLAMASVPLARRYPTELAVSTGLMVGGGVLAALVAGPLLPVLMGLLGA